MYVKLCLKQLMEEDYILHSAVVVHTLVREKRKKCGEIQGKLFNKYVNYIWFDLVQ